MKINVLSIAKDHFDTLYDHRTKRISILDLLIFYVFPIFVSMFCYSFNLTIKPEAYNISITFFGIFIALILNIQVAMFSIFQRKWVTPSDSRIASSMADTLSVRRKLLTELNANLSYLILVCCAALIISLLSFIRATFNDIVPALMVFLYSHFVLTLLMIVKRAHALFHKEYRDSPD